MPQESSDKSAWNRLACALESVGEALLKLAEGVSKSPPRFRIGGLCVVAVVLIFGFITVNHIQSIGMYVLAFAFAIIIVVILKMCLSDSHKEQASEKKSLSIINEKTNSYEDDE